MLTIIAASLCFSAFLLAVSVVVPTQDRTDWPMTIFAHVFWPVALALVIRAVIVSRRTGTSGA